MKSLALLVALSFAVPCVAAEKPAAKSPAKKRTAPAKTVEPAAASGLRAFRDPVTGELRQPTEDELRSIDEGSRRALPEERVSELIVHPDGSKSMNLVSGYMTSVVVRKDAQGKVEKRCFDDPAAERAFLAGSKPAVSRAEQ